MSPRARRIAWYAAWIVPVAVLVVSARIAPPPQRTGSFVERLLGPFARVAAQVQWARFDAAIGAGRDELAYARARSALALAPADAQGYVFLAHHLAFERGSPSREPDRAARARWLAAAFDVLDRGEASSDEPGVVAFKRGVVALALARLDDDVRAFPPTRAQAWLLAAEAFERAAAAGIPAAAEAARAARAEL